MSKPYLYCVVEREKIVTLSTWNLETGEKILKSMDTVIEPCDTPLFSKDECATGICNSCHNGWETEGNKLTACGRQQIGEKR